MSQRTFISKEGKNQAPEFKAVRDKRTLTFCVNAVSFMIGTALIYKLLTPKTWREKINTSCLPLVVQQDLDSEKPFQDGSISAFSLKSGSILLVRDCLLKFFWYWTMPLLIQNSLNSTSLKASKWSKWKWKLLSHVWICDPMHYRVHGILQARILEWVAFPFSRGSSTQGLNPGLLHCRWNLYQLSHQGSPRILEWVAYPFCSESSRPRNQTRVSCIEADSLPTELSGKPTK